MASGRGAAYSGRRPSIDNGTKTMQFSAICGHEDVKRSLRQMVTGERLPHALMLLGPEGSGKLALALAYACYVLCEERGEDGACGRCRSCLKSTRFIHPDLHFSFPTVGTNITSDAFLPQWRTAMADNPHLHLNEWLQLIGAENRQGNINKEECLAIIRKLSLKTFEGRYKVLVMWMPELLGKEGNRLLKIIEEPPENTLFVLVAEDPEKILNTILSRCQIVKVSALRDEEVRDGLLRRFPGIGERAQSIAYLADGNFNTALHMAAQRENDNAPLFLDWMRRCYKGDGVELVQWSEQFAGLGRENQKYFLQYALHFLREYLVLKMTGADRVRLQEKELTTAGNLTKVIGFEQAEAMAQLLTTCMHAVERNAHPKVLFLDASIRLHGILKNKPLVLVDDNTRKHR